MSSTSQLAPPTPGTHRRPASRTWQRVVGVVLAVHAVAHLAGTSTAISTIDDGRSVDILGGLAALDTAATLWTWAAAWAVLAVVTAAAAAWTLLDRTGARRVVALAATVSLAACVIGLWATAIGVAVNAGVLATTRLSIWSRR